MSSISKCSVLVVGAGPTGLFLAGELHRQGVDCRIVEKASGPCENARATGMQTRTLEILGQIGLVDAFLSQGNRILGVKSYAEGNRLIDQKVIKDLESPFPFELSLPQSRTERLLLDYLSRCGQAVEWNVELVSFEQDEKGVRAVLRPADGIETTIEADYLVGCDGSHSTVRHQLGLHLEGSDYPALFAVADVRINGPLPTDEVTLYTSPTTGLLIAPLPDDRFLLLCDLPEKQSQPEPGCTPTLGELQDHLDRIGPGNLTLHDTTWLAYFHCHKRLVPHYQMGRVFLAGDAAHVQSPAGGQGMNTGIQDGYNLAWKLALVLRAAASPSLLDSYHAERHYIGKEMLELSDQMHRHLFDHHPRLGSRTHKWMADLLVRFGLRHPRVRTPDEIGVCYHHSPIVKDHEPGRGGAAWRAAPRAGNRIPDGRLIAHPEGRVTRLFELIREPRHHLLVLQGEKDQRSVQTLSDLAGAIVSWYGRLIEPRVILCRNAPPDSEGRFWLDGNGDLHRRYGAVGPSLYLIRPDGHVGYRSPTLNREALGRYLGEIFGNGTCPVPAT